MSPVKKRKTKAATSRRTPKKPAPKKAGSKRVNKAKLPEKKEVKIAAAKGRPMLTWVGKRPLQRVTAFPAQLIEKFDPRGELREAEPQTGGLLFHGDNKEVLAYLLANGYRGKVNLIYIDPPFDSGADYLRRVTLRGISGTAKLGGETYTLGEQVQYTDIWANDNYLQFMYERLLLLKELLANDGSIYLHTDSHRTHQLRCLMDEVFGAENFKNDIVWQRFNYRADGVKFGTVHDTILFYAKSDKYTFKKPYVSLKSSYIKTHFRPDESGRMYRLDNLTAPSHGKQGKALRFGDKMMPPPPGTMWRHAQEGIDNLWSNGLIDIPEDGVPQVKRYLDEIEGQAVHSLWTDISSINSQSEERKDYPTQKPESLLERILGTSSNVDDLVLDCFVGSGTTAAVAQELGRRWISCDINKGAIQTTSKRLQTIIEDQIEAKENSSAQGKLIELENDEAPKPAQLSFAVYRVNDYDLQIQHNEAVNLACEHIGIKRTKSDSFFEGELGKKLVKIVPFNHPLSPLDLEEIKNELAARPDEDRDIAVVSLGKELAVDGWLEDWNRYRKQKGFPNKIEIIELRTDERYGKFFEHKPARAKIDIKRADGKIKILIRDFISPTILERLQQQAGILAPQIDDWRSMVDSVMIDTAYDGKVFNVTYSDVPKRKNDLVEGKYELAPPKGKTTVAVKITDMLGGEVLDTQRV